MKRTAIKRATTIQPSGKRMRQSRPKSTPARKAAKGQACMVRLPGCDGGGETTCLAHYSLAGLSGAGMKSPDLIGAHCCHSCHAIADGRAPRPEGYTRNDVRLALAEGVLRTIAARGEV